MAFALAVLLAACGVALTQPPPAPGPNIPPVSPPLATPPVIPTPPPPPTLDQLLDQLEQVQTQKAELAKREESLRQIIRKKLDEQDQRLKKLGLAPMPKEAKAFKSEEAAQCIAERLLNNGTAQMGKMPEVRARNIIIEQIVTTGGTDKEHDQVREALGIEIGQVFLYPVVLDEMRARLKKAGFSSATVKVLGSDPQDPIKTLIVKLPGSK
jgi:hypothetical protein